jgi:hypothetical protein
MALGRRWAVSARSEHAHAPDDLREPELTPTESKILEFERAWSARVGAKDAAIRAEFEVPAARYYQMLSALIDSPVALRSDPLLVRRLQRVRDARAAARAARTFRLDPTPSPQDPTE